MAHPILMPKPGQMTEECVLVAWHKREGDQVQKGDLLFEIESDKSNMDVEAFEEGVLLKRYVQEGETVPVNSLCAYVGEPGEAVPDQAPPVAAAHTEGTAKARTPAAAGAPAVRGLCRARPFRGRRGRSRRDRGIVVARGAIGPPAHQPPGQQARCGLRSRSAADQRHRAGGSHHRARRPGRARGRGYGSCGRGAGCARDRRPADDCAPGSWHIPAARGCRPRLGRWRDGTCSRSVACAASSPSG